MLGGLFGENWDDPRTALTMGLAQGLMGARSLGGATFGDALSAGIGQGMPAYQQARQLQTRERTAQEEMALRRQEMGIRQDDAAQRRQEFNSRIAEAQRNQQMEARRDQYLAAVAEGHPIRAAEAMLFKLKPSDVKELVESENWGKPKVAQWKQIKGPNGVEEIGLDEYGQPVQGARVTPFVRPEMLQLGGSVQAVDMTQVQPGQSWQKTMTPGEEASNAIARGNLGVAQANLGLSRERLGLEREAQANGGKAPAGYRWTQAGGLEPIPGGPADKSAVQSGNAQKSLLLVKEAEKLLDKSTGSVLGTGFDVAAGAFGASTPGAQASAQLKVIQGALMMNMPRMEGPQSDKDTQLYREAAGQIGNSMIPAATRKAALQTIRQLNEKYAGGAQSGGATGGWGDDPLGLRR